MFDINLYYFSRFKLRFDHIYQIFPIAELEAQYLMTSQIRTRVEYVIPTDNIPALLLYSNLIFKIYPFDEFSILFNENSEMAYFSLSNLYTR